MALKKGKGEKQTVVNFILKDFDANLRRDTDE